MAMTKSRIVSIILSISMLVSLFSVMAVGSFAAEGIITEQGGWLESAYVEWTPISGADGYNVYVASAESSAWKCIDDMLIRKYADYWRADAVGLKAGNYNMKVVPVVNGAEDDSKALITSDLEVTPHDRSGFAFVNGTSSGAYNEDGTLKSNARVIYVTNENKNTVTMNLTVSKNGPEPFVGIQNILTALKKGYEKDPICIRFIGNITDPTTLDKGDLLVDFGEGKFPGGMTIEGIGEDTVFNGFGIRIKGVSNLEVRNIAFMNCDSNEGDSVSLQQDNDHIWVHNCDIFYGMAGSDADQDKGDGALDTKKSTYITHSYNHFWDAGKSCLLGNSGETEENYLTYHHNWFDHSDSRHPRVRTASVHVYNNFYDGVAKYGIGATMGASIFSEANYFLNTKNPMLISMQGTDMSDGEGTFSSEAGGIIKSFGNVFVNSSKVVDYSQNKVEFDVYTVANKTDKVPSNVTAKNGGSDYNNFDTSSVMYSYEAQTAEDAMESVKAYAGRMNGGDFEWTFKAGSESSYAVDSALKAAVTGYKGSIVSYGGNGSNSNPDGGNTNPDQGGNEGDNEGGSTNPDQGGSTVPDSAQTHSFTANGKTDPEKFFAINGNISKDKGSTSYNGENLTICLKIESSTNISFTTAGDGVLTLVFGGKTDASGKAIKVDGEKYTIPSTQILEVELGAGTHSVTKTDSINLFYMVYTPAVTDTPETPEKPEHAHSYESVVTAPTCTEGGYTTYTCACGDTYVGDEVAALGHDIISHTQTLPTCTADGIEAGGECIRCDYTFGLAVIEALGHDYNEGQCTRCGDADPDYVAPHEHSFVDGKCECGEVDPDYTPETPDHEHSFVDGKCECGETDPDYIAPHEHSFIDGMCECGEVDPNYTPEPPAPPKDPEAPEEPENLNLFQRIIKAILNFFKKLFGKKN